MSTTTIAGKPSNTIGEKDSTLVLRGSSIKIQWGNKFIDLIKNGKINSDSQKLLKTADTVEELTTDGLYLVGDSVWAVIGGTKVQLSGASTTTYVSYLTEQKDVTGEQKERALTNIGFYYETLEEANAAGLTSGIIYVKGDNKLYLIKDGILTEYINTQNTLPSTENTENEESTENLYIEGNSLWVGNDKYITCDDNVYTNELLILEQGLQSSNASSKQGYRLYIKNGQSYLEVDNIIQRNLKEVDTTIQPIKYYQEENIILQAVEETETEIISNLIITLLYSDKYKIGDTLTTSLLLDNEVEYTNEGGEIDVKTEKVITSLDFKIVSLGENNTYSVSTNSDKITPSNISQLVNKPIYYKQGELPVARISDHNYDLFKAGDQTLENVSTRIGSLQELKVDLITEPISTYTKRDLGIYSDNAIFKNAHLISPNIYISEVMDYDTISTKIGYISGLNIRSINRQTQNFSTQDQGIYSDNAFLENSYLFNTNQYNTIFKNINNIYPKYEEGWFIPEDSDDQTIVTSLWVNDKIEPIWNEINVIKESIKSIENLEDRLDQAESDIDELEKSVKNLEDSLDSLGDSIPNVSGLTSDVSTLKSNVSTLQTDVSNLKKADTSINNEIDNIWEEIDNITDSSNTANLQEQIDELTSKIEELSLLPKVLISGTVYRDNADSLSWKFTGVLDRTIAESGDVYNYITAMPLTTSINGGVLKIEWTNSRYTNIVACSAQMQTSGMVTTPTSGEYKSTDGDKAMYWFGTYSDGRSTYIRAMTQADQNNDTAISYDELWGPVNESHKYGILSFSIIATGYKM